MRGKENFSRKLYLCFGITPAYAGKRFFVIPTRSASTDHPRLCGEKIQVFC